MPENFRRPGVVLRLVLAWVLSTGVPLLMIILSIAASKFSLLNSSADSLLVPLLLMAIAALVIGHEDHGRPMSGPGQDRQIGVGGSGLLDPGQGAPFFHGFWR